MKRQGLAISTIAAILAVVFGVAVVIVAIADEMDDGPRSGFQRGGRVIPAVLQEETPWA